METMSFNSTDGWENFPLYLSYSIQGLVISFCNLIIVFSILKYEALRTNKEYLVMLGLSLADSCLLCGFLTAGVYRIYLLMTEAAGQLLTPWQCATKLHNLFLTVGLPWSHIMLTVMSVDRLLCVSMPLNYLGWPRSYIYSMLGLSLGGSMISCCTYMAFAYFHSDGGKVTALCMTYDALRHSPNWFSTIFPTIPSIFGFLSVIIYMGVWYKHKKHFSQIMPAIVNENQQQEQLRHQHKITVSLGMSCFCTFMLLCVPMTLANVFLWFDLKPVALFFYFLSTFNPLCNVFIYQVPVIGIGYTINLVTVPFLVPVL